MREAHWLVVFLLVGVSLAQTCNNNGTRLDCKQYSQSTCVAKGCCWSPVDPNPSNQPWCFYPDEGSPVCTISGTRQDCGYTGITQTQCENQKCCWNPVTPNPDNEPYCFFSNPVIKGYSVSSVQNTATGLLIDLTVLDPQNQYQYGTPISSIRVLVDYDTETRLHVKIFDPNNTRWEVPQSLIPRSPPASKALSPRYAFTYTESPFGFAVTRLADNVVMWNSTAPYGATWNGLQFKDQFLSITTGMDSDSNIFGLQESSQSAGFKLTHKTYTLWNHDTPSAASDINLYGSHPFYLQVLPETGNAHGVFLLNSNGMDVIYAEDHLTYNVIGGVLDFYFFTGPSADEVVQQYTNLIGLPHMQPYWAYGFHQSRYGMPNLEYLEQVVQNFSIANIPLDTIWSDIDCMDLFKDFTWDPVNYPFPQVQLFTDQLHQQHQQYVVILDPGIKYNDLEYSAYNRLIDSKSYIYDVNGDPFVGQVWPGYTIFPDFLNPDGVTYWDAEIKEFLNGVPLDGLWIDMNEISNFCSGECLNGNPIPYASTQCGCTSFKSATSWLEVAEEAALNREHRVSPLKNKFRNEQVQDSTSSDFDPVNPPYAINNNNAHSPLNDKTIDMNAYMFDGVSEYNAHNIYGLAEAVATHTTLQSWNNKRPFVLSRSTFAGSGKWTAHWTGDNASQWVDMFYSIVGMLNFNILGVPMIGSDICGFLDNTTEELCARWMQLGAFYPFSRNHDTIGVIPQEPYRWTSVSEISEYILRVRYSLLPLYYTLNYDSSTTGSAMIRPLFFQFPKDLSTISIDKQFLIGSQLMVAPVITKGATSVSVYFPSATWYDFYNNTQLVFTRGTTLQIPAPLNVIPVYILGGSIISRNTNPQLTTYETRKQPFNLTVALDSTGIANGYLFVDDGNTLEYTVQNTYTHFAASVVNGKGTVNSSVLNNRYSGEFSTEISDIQVLGLTSAPTSVTVNSKAWTSFSYDTESRSLILSDLGLDIGTALTIKWA
jgi:alpha-D-xyloside xylohydrolase